MAWQPQQQGVEQICQLLSAFQQPGSNQAQILAQLEQCRAFPDFNNYLAFIFAQGDAYPVEVRQSAGLLLKNNLRQQYSATSDDFRSYIKAALLHSLVHQSRDLRRTAGTVIGVVVGVEGMGKWPQLVQQLMQSLELSAPKHALQGALDTLYKICEDTPGQIDTRIPELGGPPGSVLIPRLLALFSAQDPESRCLSVACLNLMAGSMPKELANQLDRYIQGLFSLAYDASTDVRRAVCTGLVQMLTLQPDRLEPQMSDIIEYMLRSTQDGDEGVALESCEFWSAFCDAEMDPAVLRPFLPRLIPVLLKNMVFEEDDEEVIDAEMADDTLGVSASNHHNNHDQELKPFIHRGRGGGGGEDDEDDGDEVSSWNLRKCSAAGLDVLAVTFGEELLPIVLPIVQARLQEQDWRARESATLALGAIAEGCASGLMPFLNDMIAMLLPMLNDPRPLVRSITCWALSRYSQWIVKRAREAQHAPNGAQNGVAAGPLQLDAVLEGLLQHVTDHNRRVQEAACSALATLEEEAKQLIAPRIQPILTTFSHAWTSYSRKNLRILYDAISMLAEGVGPHIREPQNRSLLMGPMLHKWDSMPDSDRELLPLMECFTVVARVLGPAFEEYAPPTYARCLRLLSLHVAALRALQAGQSSDLEPDKQFIMCSLDLVSGMAEGLGSSVESLVSNSNLVELAMQCCQDPSQDVRQSAFALLGDMARSCPSHLMPHFQAIVTAAMHQLEPSVLHNALSASNNACWALGELFVKVPPELLQQVALPVVERLVPILAAPSGIPRSIRENSAITLGRIAWVVPEPLAPHLSHFIWHWCAVLRTIPDDIEKEHAFLGLCRLVRLNPQGALTGFVKLCEAVVSWKVLHCEGLANELVSIMQLYKQTLASVGQWDGYLRQLEPAVRDKLIHMCKLQ